MSENFLLMLKYNLNRVIRNKIFIALSVFFLFVYIWVISETVNSDGFSNKTYKEYKSNIMNGDITSDYKLDSDINLVTYIADEENYPLLYSDYINRVFKNGSYLIEISIFSGGDEDDFSRLNIQKTMSDFADFRDISIGFTGTKGFSSILNNNLKNNICFIMMGLIVILLRQEDIRMNMTPLTNTTINGRGVLAAVNISCILIFSFFITLIYAVLDLGLAFAAYGDIPFLEPVQALYGYGDVTIRCSIGVYLMIRILLKVFTLFSVSMVLAAVSVFAAKKINSFFIFVVIFLVMELCKFIPLHSVYEFIRYISFSDLLDVDILLNNYVNVNLFGSPVRQYMVAFVFATLILIIGGALFIFSFSKTDIGKKEINIHEKILNKKVKSHSILYFELKKCFLYKKLWIIGAVILFLSCFYNSNHNIDMSINDRYYKYYVNIYEGEITESKLQDMEETAKKYEEYNHEKVRVKQAFEAGEISESEYFSEIERYDYLLLGEVGFNAMRDRVELCLSDESREEKPYLVYDKGWKLCLGLDDNNNEKVSFLFLMLFIIIGVSGIFTHESEIGMDKLIYVYKNSGKLKNQKFITGLVTIPVGMAITYLPLFIYSYRAYGLSYIFAPVSSVGQLFNFAFDVNILSYTILFFVVRILKMLVLATLVMILSMKLKNNIKTIMCFLPFIVIEMLL